MQTARNQLIVDFSLPAQQSEGILIDKWFGNHDHDWNSWVNCGERVLENQTQRTYTSKLIPSTHLQRFCFVRPWFGSILIPYINLEFR